MLRTASTTILILAGSALGATLLCLLLLRLVFAVLFALTGVRRHVAREQVLNW
jgi:hypothetical protein